MTYPKIYSLSTVGVLKHYVHDYLFHSLRTDFIGPNGVGKSIIADLMQLMFVFDTALIKFGTDGVKKDERSIYKLPYDLATAYCFLNVEVEAGQYIIIGIALPSQSSSRITPFVISRSAELERDISELTLSSEQRLLAKDLLHDGQVPDLKMLATKLLADRQLYLSFFRTKEDTKRYYQFLYEKQILSINLSIDDHLSAFAKVIQSFSKAKSLDLSPAKASKSLKQFLFEDNDLGLEAEFRRQQGQLEKLLRDFSSLETYIKELRLKQSQLTDLNRKNELQQATYKKLMLGRISNARFQLIQEEKAESALKNEMEIERAKKESSEQLLAEIPSIKHSLKEKLDASNDYVQLHTAYLQATQNAERLNSDVIELKVINPPSISSEWSSVEDVVEIDDYSVSQIKQFISDATPYLEKFTDPTSLEREFDMQKEHISTWYQSIKKRIADIDQLTGILNNNSDDSVLGWGMVNNQGLTPLQQNVLMHYATRAINPPKDPRSGDSYFDPEMLLQARDGDTVVDGFWLQLGALKEYVMLIPDEVNPLSTAGQSQTITHVLKNLVDEKDGLSRQLKELDILQRGGSFDRGIILHYYDPFLTTYDNIKRVHTAAAIIRDLEYRIQKTEESYTLAQAKVHEIRSQLPGEIVYDEPEVVERELKRLSNEALNNYTSCCQQETMTINNFKQSELMIEKQRQQLTQLTSTILSRQSDIAILNNAYYDIYQEHPEENLSVGEYADLEKLNISYLDAKQEYQVKYMEVVGQFQETNSQKHASVNREVSQKNYDFAVLEQALLVKIKHTDNISQELEDANRNRMNMADDIKNTMVLIFNGTVQAYKQYKTVVYTLNQFFQGVKISNRFFFSINFSKNEQVPIDILEDIGSHVRNATKRGELPFDKPVGNFIQEFFQRTARLKEAVTIDRLLDPKTFFDLSVSLTDEYGHEIPGSTGETYSAIALLGIARLSIVQKEKRRGLRFIILEELGSLDAVNFNTFPAIAKEFAYQIITMAPSPFRSNLDDEWYAHHLIKGISDPNINYAPSASYFKTKNGNQELTAYLKLRQQ